jgi:hypothetical protein
LYNVTCHSPGHLQLHHPVPTQNLEHFTVLDNVSRNIDSVHSITSLHIALVYLTNDDFAEVGVALRLRDQHLETGITANLLNYA